MGGKTKIGDLPLPLHLLEERDAPIMQVIVYIIVSQGVNEVKVDVIHPIPLQLLGKGLPVVGIGPYIVLCSDVIAVPGIAAQGLTHKPLGLATVIDIGGIKVIDPVFHGVVDNLTGLFIVNISVLTAGKDGQAHIAHTQPGKGDILKFLCDHTLRSSLCFAQGQILPFTNRIPQSDMFFKGSGIFVPLFRENRAIR